MEQPIKKLIETKNHEAIRVLLSNNPNLVNEGISYDELNTAKAHPLHRICDAVFSKKITDEEAIDIAKIFLDYGANINGGKIEGGKDTPLIAAASLHAEQLGIFYIENGADIHSAGSNGASALHWAAYCGKHKLLERLIYEKAEIDLRDSSFNATPLGWAIHAFMNDDQIDNQSQVECIKLLLRAGSDINLLHKEARQTLQNLAHSDLALRALL
jgi:uncharacterized protein